VAMLGEVGGAKEMAALQDAPYQSATQSHNPVDGDTARLSQVLLHTC